MLGRIKNIALAVLLASTLSLGGACYGLYQLNESTRANWELQVSEIVADSHVVTMAAERAAHAEEVESLRSMLKQERALRLEAQKQETNARQKNAHAEQIIRELKDENGCLDRPVDPDLLRLFLDETAGADGASGNHQVPNR